MPAGHRQRARPDTQSLLGTALQAGVLVWWMKKHRGCSRSCSCFRNKRQGLTPGVLLQDLGAQPGRHSAPGTHPPCIRPLTGDGHPKRAEISSPAPKIWKCGWCFWACVHHPCRKLQDHKRAAYSAKGRGTGGFVPCPSDHWPEAALESYSPRVTCLYRFAVPGFTNAQGSFSDTWESLCHSHLLPKATFWAVTGSNGCQKLLKAMVPGQLIQYRDRARSQDTGCLEGKPSEDRPYS